MNDKQRRDIDAFADYLKTTIPRSRMFEGPGWVKVWVPKKWMRHIEMTGVEVSLGVGVNIGKLPWWRQRFAHFTYKAFR